ELRERISTLRGIQRRKHQCGFGDAAHPFAHASLQHEVLTLLRDQQQRHRLGDEHGGYRGGEQPPEEALWPRRKKHVRAVPYSVTTPTPITYPSPYTVLMICGARASSPRICRRRLTRTSMLRSKGSASRPRRSSVSCARVSTRLPAPSSTASSRYSAPLRATSRPSELARVRVTVSSRQPPKEKPRTFSGRGSRGACAERRSTALMRPRSSRGLKGLAT